jgi:cytochrome oxidase Cu insertion factor (SCO1/SenC/PrrC family)
MIFRMTIRTFIALLAAGIAFSVSAPAADPKAPATAKRTEPIKTGEAAPDFTLTDQNGQSHTLSAERGTRAVVLVFYRGYW